MNDSNSLANAMTVDVEDYFHVTALSGALSRDSWGRLEYRAVQNTQRVLRVFADFDVQATFFILGWVAKRSPELVREIHAAGHEIACHGMSHELVYKQTRQTFRDETREAKRILEDAIGARVRGYRAASYSITRASLWALDELTEAGFEYDSSIFPVRHDIYGMRHAPRQPFKPGAGNLLEIPLTTVELLGARLPCGGGGYFRIFPYGLFKWALRYVNASEQLPAVFYFHPWEIDPDQPRVEVGWRSRFRHYYNLRRTEPRLKQLLKDFRWDRMDRIFLEPSHLAARAVVPLAVAGAS